MMGNYHVRFGERDGETRRQNGRKVRPVPTPRSGAFLFAAIRVLKPIYEAVLDRMEALVEVRQTSSVDLSTPLAAAAAHPNHDYFITKSIIVHNLYGVDIMAEATEICKLRLFLRMVADLNDARHIEPLPDIDFNIRAGNALVGYVQPEEIGLAYSSSGVAGMNPRQQKLLAKVRDVQRELRLYRNAQLQYNPSAETFRAGRQWLRDQISELDEDLNTDLLKIGQIRKEDDGSFNTRPFHWFTAFYEILDNGGFDVIVGNPPYVEYSKVKGSEKIDGEEKYRIYGYKTVETGNLFSFIFERSLSLKKDTGSIGLIVPVSFLCTERMVPLQSISIYKHNSWNSSFDMRPSSLFTGVSQRLTITIIRKKSEKIESYFGGFRRWTEKERDHLLNLTSYIEVDLNDFKSGYMPKISENTEYSIFKKMTGSSIVDFEIKESKNPIYIHRIVRYFVKAIDFIPYFWNNKDGIKKSDDYKPFYLDDKYVYAISAIINSSLFYWYWHSFSDGFHCGYRDVRAFRLGDFKNSKYISDLDRLGRNIIQDIRSKSIRKRIQSKSTGYIEYDELTPRLSLNIVRDIDTVIQKHYGFTDEELDFLVNYDIKYRMTQDTDGDSGE
ncbi:MAG: hypothetical protein OHK0022_44270 [Roseiflexaceae bacterium]